MVDETTQHDHANEGLRKENQDLKAEVAELKKTITELFKTTQRLRTERDDALLKLGGDIHHMGTPSPVARCGECTAVDGKHFPGCEKETPR